MCDRSLPFIVLKTAMCPAGLPSVERIAFLKADSSRRDGILGRMRIRTP